VRSADVLRALGPIDARSIARDSLLGWLVLLVPLLGLLVRWGTPRVDAWTRADFGVSIAPYHPLVMSYFVVLLVPMMVGTVIGFLLLDERDDDTLTALLVTPLSPDAYLRYRIGAPLLASVGLAVLAFHIAGLTPLPALPLLGVVVVAALEGPLLALFLAAYAADKVQGFALMKGIGAVVLAPVAAYWVATPWQYLAGLVPSYWPIKAFWLAVEGEASAWLFLGIGLAVHLALLVFLRSRFRRALYR
jgi:fluoroquinolone transport system permease protein